MTENWVDLAVIFVLVAFALRGLQRGLLVGLVDLVGFLGALVLALQLYPWATEALAPYLPLPTALLRLAAFLGLWLVLDLLFSLLARAVVGPLHAIGARSTVNTVLGVLPGLGKGAAIVALTLTLALAVPLPEPVKADVAGARLAAPLARIAGPLEPTLREVFGEAVLEGVSFATVRPQSNERVDLKFTLADARLDPTAELRLLELVNEERTRAGLRPLTTDPALVEAARQHARDMLAEGYFAHLNNDGLTPADRGRAAGARFFVLGENLALAPTVELAHRGLLDSPGHRANILGAQFGRVGIGAADAGLHGKMFVQEFAD